MNLLGRVGFALFALISYTLTLRPVEGWREARRVMREGPVDD